MRRVRVIACGTPDAADDGVGVAAVRRAEARLARIHGVDVVEARTADALIELLEGIDAAVVVDAVRVPGRARPGRIVRAGPDGSVGATGVPALSSHGIGVEEAVALAAALGHTPTVSFLGVEISDATVGGGMTARVARSVPRLADAVVASARSLVDGERAA